MKEYLLTILTLALFVSFGAMAARAQSGTVAGGHESVLKDIEAEKNAMHELIVARHYFHNKKAYYAAYKRADELVAGYPEFSKLDEALYIAAMSSVYLAEGKGKQAVPKSPPEKAQEFSPDALRAGAREYLSRIVNDYPESKFRKDAETALGQLGGAQAKEDKKQ